MSLIKFYRGATGVSLPAVQDGAIFIVKREADAVSGAQLGDMYVDMGQDRIHITSESPIQYVDSTWPTTYAGTRLMEGQVFIVKDISGNPDYAIVGDGIKVVSNLQKHYIITQARKDAWDAKLDSYIRTQTSVTGEVLTVSESVSTVQTLS